MKKKKRNNNNKYIHTCVQLHIQMYVEQQSIADIRLNFWTSFDYNGRK